jgi:hypothetical protein
MNPTLFVSSCQHQEGKSRFSSLFYLLVLTTGAFTTVSKFENNVNLGTYVNIPKKLKTWIIHGNLNANSAEEKRRIQIRIHTKPFGSRTLEENQLQYSQPCFFSFGLTWWPPCRM